MSPSTKLSPDCLLTPPSFNLSFGSDLNGELLSCVDKIDFGLVSSTPVLPKHTHTRQNAVLSEKSSRSYTSLHCDLSSSQIVHQKLNVTGSVSVPGLTSFIATPTKDVLENLKLSQWGIPDIILEQYAKRGITSMYKWQAECLMQPGVLQGGNLVFSAPTSAGKTFIAELLALKCIIEARKKVIIILPFVSIAHEKATYLQSIFEPNGVKVGGFMGGHLPSGGFSAVDIAICTIEKANSLVNRLLEEGGMSQLGTVVVDELHMIGDSHRGYLLELLLTKLLYISRKCTVSGQACLATNKVVESREVIQIIGMSATLPNLNVLSNWLDGQLYCTEYRPVPLQEMVKIGSALFDTDFKKIRELSPSELANDEEDILKLCQETVVNGHSVLIFCPTKQWCENLAGIIAVAPFLQNNPTLVVAANEVTEGGKGNISEAHMRVLEQLRRTQVGLDAILEKTVPSGVAFHHAGLTFDEREIIEGAFRQGVIRVLVATSTLSSGVNLPARLVIVRTPFFQKSLIDILVYKQMVGRAGRKGVDERGESVLICKPNEQSKVINLFKSAPKAVSSCLGQSRGQKGRPGDMSALRRALLEVISSGVATSQADIEMYVSCTLLFAEMNRASPDRTSSNDPSSVAKNLISSTADYLIANEFVACRALQPNQPKDTTPYSVSGSEYHATQLGAATVASALSPEEALVVFAELRKARKNFVLESELHIIYLVCSCICLLHIMTIHVRLNTCTPHTLHRQIFAHNNTNLFFPQVTPVYVQEQWPSIDWYRFLCLLERLPADIKHVANTLGVQESFLASAVQGRIPERTPAQQERLRIHRRFFTALALHDLVHEYPIVYVARKYSVSKGLLQTLQSAAGTFSGMVTVFCSRLGWKNMELLLSQFQSRLSFGVERELCDLVKISLLNGFRARALYNFGFHSLSAVATANPLAIEQCLRNAVPFKSSKVNEGTNDGEDTRRRGTTWCAKLRRGMTELEAACEIVREAQNILSEQINLPLSAWNILEQGRTVGSPSHTCKVEPVNERNKVIRKSPNPHLTDGKRSRVSEQLATTEKETSCEKRDNITPFKTPKQKKIGPIKKACTRSGANTASPLFTLSNVVALGQAIPQSTVNKQPESSLVLPCSDTMEKDSISYSPIFSPDLSANFQQSKSVTTLPLEPFELCSPQNRMYDAHSSHPDSHPLTVPSSLPCSMDMSASFSCTTLALIDAVCQGDGPTASDMSCSLISGPDNVGEGNDVIVEKVPESPALIDSKLGDGMVADIHVHVAQSSHTLQENKTDVIPVTTSSKVNAVAQQGPPCTQSQLSLASSSQVSLSQSGTCIIDVTSNSLLFQTFVSECLEQTSLTLSVAVSFLDNHGTIGVNIIEPKTAIGIPIPNRNEQVMGVAFCWGGMDVYYVSLCKPVPGESGHCVTLATRVEALHSILQSTNCQEVIAYSLKNHVKILTAVFGIVLGIQTLDPQVADWMLDPDGKEKTIHRMVLHYLPDQPLLSEGEDHEDMPLSTLATHASEPHIRASAEALLASLLICKMRPLLEEEGLIKSFLEVEMPSLVVLTKMELNGIGFSKEECDALKRILELRLLQIETEAYTHARRSFSLTSPEDVSQVLFFELQLPPPTDQKQHKTLGPNRRGKKRIQHFSTAKDVLEKLKSLHPLPGLVLEWRRVSSTVTKTVFPLFKEAVNHTGLNSVRIHSSYHIHTATGRVATSDPNLQMVPKDYDIGTKASVAAMFNSKEADACALLSESQCFRDACSSRTEEEGDERSEQLPSSISMRSVFVPFPGGVFLAADYSQLELRVLAHMSGDTKLQSVLNSEGDVFKMIAGEWLGVPAGQVTAKERQDAKQICYGMIYGIGPKALSEQLNISQEDAAQFMETFKFKYPAMRKFITSTVQSCRDSGHIVTLLGRKRYLSGIHSQNIHARSQAERQAVNSTIQGSAADLVKTAMINIDRVLSEEYKTSRPFLTLSETIHMETANSSKSTPVGLRGAYLVLQLHDELLYEVCERDLPRVAEIVQYQMENALQLSVRFPVKMQVGSSWGNLKPYTHPSSHTA